MASPASFSVQEVPREKRGAATPLRMRVIGGGGEDGFGGGGARMVFAGVGFCGGRFCGGMVCEGMFSEGVF